MYWPHLPEDFVLAAGPGSSEQGSFFDALYVSFVYPTTLRSDHVAGTSRRAAAEVRLGLDRLAATLAGGFPGVGGEGTEAILLSHAEDQRDEPMGGQTTRRRSACAQPDG